MQKPPAGGFWVDLTGRLPTLPHSCLCSTIGAEELNYRVRDGNGWVLLAKVTQKLVTAKAGRQPLQLNIDGLRIGKQRHDCVRSSILWSSRTGN